MTDADPTPDAAAEHDSPPRADRVEDRPDESRFVLLRGDTVIGESQYRRRDGAIVFTHTEVDPSLQERGLGSRLVRAALDEVRVTGERVVARCPFVRRYIEEHPEYADLTER